MESAISDNYAYINQLKNFDLITSGKMIFNLLELRRQVLSNFLDAQNYNQSELTDDKDKVSTDFYIERIRMLNEQIKALMCL
jgi:phage-related protein